MSLKEVLMADLKQAMKDKDVVRKNTVQSVRAGVLQVEKDDQVLLDDDGVIRVINAQLKKRKAALPEYEMSGRQELIDELKQEIQILTAYLPEQLSEEELRHIILASIEATGAASMKDMGKVMSDVSAKVNGRADNKTVSQIVKSILT